MKKSAALAAALVLCASQAWAYDNLQAGYSVQDKEPFYKMASSKLYAYSNFSSASLAKLERMDQASVHLINYYTADEMKSILGEKFSTDYFVKQYEKMALLQRSQLDVRTVPSLLVDMERYAAHENKNNLLPQQQLVLKEQLQKLKPIISVSKISGRNVINISYLYKQNQDLVAVDTSLLSANDRLYMLSTVTIDEQALAETQADDDAADVEQDNTSKTYSKNGKTTEAGMSSGKFSNKLSEALAKALQVENVNPDDIDKSKLKYFAQAHNKFVKGFKTLAPIDAAAPVSFTDATAQKTMTLPQDWFYGQIQFKEKEAAGTFTVAASLPTMQKIASELDYVGLFSILDTAPAHSTEIDTEAGTGDGAADVVILSQEEQAENAAYQAKLQAKAEEETRKILRSFDSMMFTCSFRINDKDFQEMLAMPRTNQLETEFFLQQSLENLKRYNNDYFSLKDYSYDLDFRQEKAVININSKISLLKDFEFTNFLRLASLSNNVGSMLFYTHKSDAAPDEQIMKDIDKWQF